MKRTHLISCLILLILLIISCTSPRPSKIKVACIGNSITYGYGLANSDSQSYPVQLQNLLGNEWEVTNYGVSARTMLKKGNLPYWNEKEYSEALKSNPDEVIIMLGTNDAKLSLNWNLYKDEFEENYKEMIQSFRKLESNPEIWICLIIPAYHEIWDISDSTIRNEVNPKILETAIDEGIGLIDLYTTMSNDSSLYLSDGIHPNAIGAAKIARYIYEIISTPKPVIQQKADSLIAPEAYTYQWYRDNIPLLDSLGGNQEKIKYSQPGTYKVSLKMSDRDETHMVSENVEISTNSNQ